MEDSIREQLQLRGRQAGQPGWLVAVRLDALAGSCPAALEPASRLAGSMLGPPCCASMRQLAWAAWCSGRDTGLWWGGRYLFGTEGSTDAGLGLAGLQLGAMHVVHLTRRVCHSPSAACYIACIDGQGPRDGLLLPRVPTAVHTSCSRRPAKLHILMCAYPRPRPPPNRCNVVCGALGQWWNKV